MNGGNELEVESRLCGVFTDYKVYWVPKRTRGPGLDILEVQEPTFVRKDKTLGWIRLNYRSVSVMFVL